jgi:signal transduction histidine kinase
VVGVSLVDRSWRESTLGAVLTAAAVIGPVVIVLALFVRSRPPGAVEAAVLIAVAIVLPLLRLSPRLSVAVRAAGLIAVLFSLSVFMLSRIGFTPALGVTLATTCVLGDIYLGRRFGFLLVVASGLAAFVVGLLVSDGTVPLSPDDVDPMRLRNWVRMALATSLTTAMLMLGVDVVIRQVEATSRAAADARARLQRGAEQLIALGRGTAIESGEVNEAFRALCEAGVRVLDVARCSIWLLDEKRGILRCENMYERSSGGHSSGLRITAADAPAYFAALREARSLPVEDARNDPRTQQLGSYLEEHGVKSLLDAPIRYGDRVVGVVCHEHIERRVAFSPEAESYAASLADFAARAMAAADRAANERDLRLAYERLGQLNRRLEAAKEEERRFLAHELHDELGQALTALKLRLRIGERAPEADAASAAAAAASDAIAIVDDLITRVRKMSVDLRPPLLDEVGLVPALRAYLHAQSTVSGVAMELMDGDGDAGAGGADAARLSPELEIACFRVAQESITNVLRHASARKITVRIARQPRSVRLAIQDDGRGFNPAATLEAAAAGGHLGIVGMRERARAGGGTFKLESHPGKGTTVEIELPIAGS